MEVVLNGYLCANWMIIVSSLEIRTLESVFTLAELISCISLIGVINFDCQIGWLCNHMVKRVLIL